MSVLAGCRPYSQCSSLFATISCDLICSACHALSGAIKDYRIEYNPDLHSHSFESLAKKLRIMDDEKVVRPSVGHSSSPKQSPLFARYPALADAWHMKLAAVAGQGIRRTAYGGVVTLHKDGARIFVTPQGFTGI